MAARLGDLRCAGPAIPPTTQPGELQRRDLRLREGPPMAELSELGTCFLNVGSEGGGPRIWNTESWKIVRGSRWWHS